MKITGRLAGCPNGDICPHIHDTDGDTVLAQGTVVTDPAVLAQFRNVPAHEGFVELPRTLLDEPHLLTGDELAEWSRRHSGHDGGQVVLKVENRPAYRVQSDGDDLQRFRDGLTLASTEHRAWLQLLDANPDTRYRLRLFPHADIGEYGRYACHAYAEAVDHGEDIRVLSGLGSSDDYATAASDYVDLPDLLVRGCGAVLRQVYDADGTFMGGIEVTGADRAVYRALVDQLWNQATPFTSWWTEHPEHHRTLRAA
jgi:hypothetical protein